MFQPGVANYFNLTSEWSIYGKNAETENSPLDKNKISVIFKQPSTINHQPSTINLFIFFLLSLIFFAPCLNAQIKIEERVEISPQQILSDDPQFPLELRISVYPSLLVPGDIQEIGLSLCERRSFYGCYIIDFPQGQLFDAAITWDPFPGENDYNTPKLVSGTQVSDTLLGVDEGFYFKAPEYLTVSYMVAVLEIKTYISGYGLIQDDYLVSMMLDTSLVISFNPPYILPSDTVEIVIEKIRNDGVKIAYHPMQQFEVGILEGCTAGKIMAAGDTASYFNRVTQPIYFVAADSIDEEEDTLKIRVGLNQELIDTYLPLKIKYEKQLAKQRKERELKVTEVEKPVEQNPIDNPMISSCSFSTFESFLYEDVTKALGDEWCEELDECDEIEFPEIELEVHENNWEGLDVCGDDLIAGTDFFPSDNSQYREDFYIELCKEDGSDKVQFTFGDDIVINCVSDMCEDNIIATSDVLIDNAYSFPSDLSCAWKIIFLELHKEYPMPTRIITPNGIIEEVYVIRDIWMRHEEVHRDHFLMIAEEFKEEYLNKIKETKELCSKFNSEEDAKLYFKKAAEKIIKGFYDAALKEDTRISSGGDDNGDIMKFEREKIHKKVIDDYLQDLIDYWKLTNCVQ